MVNKCHRSISININHKKDAFLERWIECRSKSRHCTNLLHIGWPLSFWSKERTELRATLLVFFFSSCSIRRPSESSRSCIASVIKVETQRRVVSRWSTLVIARNHGNACLFGVLLVTEARTRRVKRVGFWGHWMQRRVVKGPEVKDALADFKKLGQRRSSIIQRSVLATFRNV